MSVSFVRRWVGVAALAVLASGCPSGGGGGGGGSNEAPDAIDDAATTGEDTPVTIDATANDTDADDDVLLVGSFTDAANGTVAIQGDGTFLYTPDPDFNGTDTFTYVVTDGPDVDATPATVTVTVNGAGDIPVAAGDEYSATEDTLLTINAATGVLGNDSDSDSSFTAVLDQSAADGTLTLAADGSFTYQPDANFDGTDTFTYHATDGVDDSSIVTVTITVAGVNDAPVADADGAYAIAEDGVLTVAAGTGVLNGDTDVDGDGLSAQVATGPSSGSLALNADGSFTYTPNANFNGSDSFTYTARDGALSSAAATVSLTVTAVNDAPVATADSYAGTEDTTLSQAAPGVLANDGDIDSGTITAVIVSGPASASSFTLNADGSFSYTPNSNFNGVDSFTYRANDSMADGNTVTVALTIGATNDAPVADNDGPYTTNEDTALVVPAGTGVLFGDTDIDGNPLNALVQTLPTKGALALNADGSFTYTPNPNSNGADSFTYVARDGVTSSAPATVSLTVTAVNDAPVANSDSYALTEDTTLNQPAAGGLLTNDTDVDTGTTLDAQLVSGPANAATFTLNVNGSFVYTPNANYSGFDSFTYRAFDGGVNSGAPTTVFISIGAVNDAPVADNDGPYATNEDTALVVIAASGVLIGDSDADGNPLNALLSSPPSNGSVALNADGSFTYTPNGNYAGPDSFQYVARDGVTSSAPATVSITVNAVNDLAITGNDAFTVAEDGSLSIVAPGVLANDSDVESAITASLVTGPSSASSFTLDANGSFDYAPSANFNGVDSFTYRANDGSGQNGNIGTVTITITSVNDPPSFTKGADVTVLEDSLAFSQPSWASSISSGPPNESAQTVSFSVTAADPAFFQSGPSIAPNGTLSFTVAANRFGGTGVTIVATDSAGASSAPQSAQITITGVNDPPSFDLSSSTVTVDEDSGPFTGTAFVFNTSPGPSGEDEPVFLDNLFGTGCTGGLYFTDGPYIDPDGGLHFTPGADANGSCGFTIRIVDAYYYAGDPAASASRSFTIVVNPINDQPSFVDSGDVSVSASSGPFTVSGWAYNILGIESPETGTFDVEFTFPADAALFNAAGLPAVSWPSGDLTFDPDFQGEAEMEVTLTDGTFTSTLHTFTIEIVDPALPPSLVSSTPTENDFLSYEEAYGSGQQLTPAVFVFDDSDLDCSGVTVTVTGSQTGGITGFTQDCSVPGRVRLSMPFVDTDQDGETITFDFASVCDSLSNCAPEVGGVAFSVSVGLDTDNPYVAEDLDPLSCQVNSRIVHRYAEPLDPASTSTFTFDLFEDGPPSVITPVAVEPNGGTGLGTLQTTNDTFWWVPRDLLVSGSLHYEIDESGFTDIAGNPSSGGFFGNYNVCGNGGGGSNPQIVSRFEFDPDQNPPIHVTVQGTEIANGAFLAPAIIDGSSDDLEIVIDTAAYFGGENLSSGNGNLNMDCRQDPCPNQSASVTFVGTDRIRFEPTLVPDFRWESGTRYSLNFNVQSASFFGSADLEFYVQVSGDTFAPRVVSISATHSASDGITPSLRPEEPLAIGLSEVVDLRSLDDANFQVVGSGGPVDVMISTQSEDRLSAEIIFLRARGVTGSPVAFAPDTYTLTVSGLQDLSTPQNTQTDSAVFSFEVGTLGGSPSLIDATPNDGSVDVSMDPGNNDRIFVAFTDAMSTSTFVDVGDASVVTRGFELVQQFTALSGFGGSITVPFKGLAPQSTECCGGGGGGGEPFRNDGTVALGFGNQGGFVSGFDNGNDDYAIDYTLTVFGDVTNIDGTAVGSDSFFGFSTRYDDGVTDHTPRLSYLDPNGIQIFPAGTFTFQGQALETSSDYSVEFSAPDSGIDTYDLYFYGSNGSVSDPNIAPQNVEGVLDATDLATLFVPGQENVFDVSIEDLNGNFFNLPQRIYYPSSPAPVPQLTFGTNGVITATGTILGTEPDASRVGSVEVGILTMDGSGTNAVALPHGQLASIVRDPSTGDVTYTAVLRDVVLPDLTPNTYRMIAAVSYPYLTSAGQNAATVFSDLSAVIPPNAPPPPPPTITISGTVSEASLTGNGPPVSGALVELVGTGIQTTTDVNGDWSLQVEDGLLVYIRYTHASYVGTQRLLTTDAGLNFGDIVLPPALLAQVYDMTSPGATHTPGMGSLFVEDFDENDPSPFSVDLGALLYDTSGQPFGNDATAFLNVDPGDDTITVTSPPGCGFETRGAIVASPAPLKITPDILTFFNLVCAEPFFTEYIDPSSGNNKAVEIYNPSTSARDLTGCTVRNIRNGGTSTTGTINLTATVAAGDVHVICHSSHTLPGGTCDQTSGSLDFTGNDVIELSCGGTVLDVIGQVGAGDPGAGGWGTPPNSTVDTTLRRRCSVTSGDGNASDPFDPSNDWQGVGTDVFTDLGSPSCIP